MTKTGVHQDREEAAGNIRIEEMIIGVEDEGEIRTEKRKETLEATLVATHAYTRNPEPSRKGDRSTAMGHTRLQRITHRERTLDASKRETRRASKLKHHKIGRSPYL